MKKKAIISVISKQKGIDDIIEVVTPGDFYKKDEGYYAVYEETEISGMKGTTTTIKINEEKVTLIRKGTTNTKMVFKDKNSDTILYNTPHGTLEMSISTKKLSIDVNDNGGKIVINYDMTVSGNGTMNTQLEIIIKAENEEL